MPVATIIRPKDRADERGVDSGTLGSNTGDLIGANSLSHKELLSHVADWRKIVAEAEARIDQVFKYPLKIRCGSGEKAEYLPTSIEAYKNAKFTIGEIPTVPLEDGRRVFESVKFGYDVKGEYRHAGTISFLVLDIEGNVVEVGSGYSGNRETQALSEREIPPDAPLRVFIDNLYGRHVTREELSMVSDVNRRVLTALREHGECNTQLRNFVKRRGQEYSWAEKAENAYYNPHAFDLFAWAAAEGITQEQLYRCGFVDRTVTKDKITYSTRKEEVVFIPFKDEQNDIVMWRMRLVNPKPGDPKYRHAPLDRADRKLESVYMQMYQAHLLPYLQNSPAMLTEGEFKCQVTTELTQCVTLGINGISQVYDQMIEEIIAARPKSFMVLLDRDPKSKGFERVDALTDSERAAYLIAMRLKHEGLEDVRIGTIPDVFNGAKCGIDDYLLHVGKEEAKAALGKILEESLSPEGWLNERGGKPELQELFAIRQRVNQSLRDLANTRERNPILTDDSSLAIQEEALQARLQDISNVLERAYRHHLDTNYGGARRISQPPREFLSLFESPTIHDEGYKVVRFRDGNTIPIRQFRNLIVELRARPLDLPRNRTLEEAPGVDFPFTMKALTHVWKHPRNATPEIEATYLEGAARLGIRGELLDVKKLSFKEFAQIVYAGTLSQIYPSDEYSMHHGCTLTRLHPGYSEIIAEVPITIKKDGVKPVALCFLPIWEHLKDTSRADRASIEEGITRAAVRTFFRNPALDSQQQKYDAIFDTIFSCIGPERLSQAQQFLKERGILPSVSREISALYLTQDDFAGLAQLLDSRQLLNQACQSGLFVIGEEGYITGRFKGPIVLLPELNSDGRVGGITVIPVGMRDQLVGNLPPTPKAAFPLDSIRSSTLAFDRSGVFFPEHAVSAIKGKTVVVVSGELEALQLISILRTHAITGIEVLAIRDLDYPSPASFKSLGLSGAEAVIFLGQNFREDRRRLQFGERAIADPDTLAAHYFELVGQKGTPVGTITLKEAPSTIFSVARSDSECAKKLLEAIVFCPLHSSVSQRQKSKLQFSNLLSTQEYAEPPADLSPHELRSFVNEEMAAFYRITDALLISSFEGDFSIQELMKNRYGINDRSSLPRESLILQKTYSLGTRTGNSLRKDGPEEVTLSDAQVAAMLDLNMERGRRPRIDVDEEFILPQTLKEYPPSISTISQFQQLVKFARRKLPELTFSISSEQLELNGKNHFIVTISWSNGENELYEGRGTAPSKGHATSDAHRVLVEVLDSAGKLKELADLANVLHRRRKVESKFRNKNYLSSLESDLAEIRKEGYDCTLLVETVPAQDNLTHHVTIKVEIAGEKFSSTYEVESVEAGKQLAAAHLQQNVRASDFYPMSRADIDVATIPDSEILKALHEKMVKIGAVFEKESYEQEEGDGKQYFRLTCVVNVKNKLILEPLTGKGDKKADAKKSLARELLPILHRFPEIEVDCELEPLF